jgi:TatA/E family protein of Tat protein translocase
MFGLQPLHWLIIILVGIFLFMPSRLPELVRAVKQMIREFRSATKETRDDSSTESSH